jgi:thiosulfate/3-mercaptopyruvate sulfurtransferase
MRWKNSWVVFGFLFLWACTSPQAEPFTGSLIEVEQLQHMMQNGESVSLIDVRPIAEFEKGHLPGAVSVWRTETEIIDTTYSGIAIDAKSLAELLGNKGVSSNNLVVLYDDKGGVEAARLWWLLKVYGFENTALLNGGLAAWTGELQHGPSELKPQQFVFTGKPHPELDMNYPQFEAARVKPEVVIIDSRSEVEYKGGELKSGASMAGHIPRAVHHDYGNNLDFSPKGKLKFKPVDDLRAQYALLAQPDDTVLLYCHSGVRSAHTLFVLTELLGYKHVVNYDGSWVEWSWFNQNSTTDTLTIQ